MNDDEFEKRMDHQTAMLNGFALEVQKMGARNKERDKREKDFQDALILGLSDIKDALKDIERSMRK